MGKKKDGGNKSQAIRDELAANPKATAAEVVEALKAKGIETSAGLVYQVKQSSKPKDKPKGKPGRKPGAAAPSTNGSLADDLMALRAIVLKHGAAEARRLVDFFAQETHG